MREDGDGDPRLEAELLAAFDHPHIVRLLGTAVLPPTSERPLPELLISMELCGGGRLPEALARRGGRRFEEAEVLRGCRGIADALAYMHARSPPVVHLDVKAENVLLYAHADLANPSVSLPLLKLCDFGSAVVGGVAIVGGRGLAAIQERLDGVTTLAYRSPELVDLHAAVERGVHEIGPPADVWALGCLTFRLAYMQMPFPENKLAILRGSFEFPTVPDNGYTQEFREFVTAMLEPDPALRLTAAQAVHVIDGMYNRTN